jgi:hypothetical protein
LFPSRKGEGDNFILIYLSIIQIQFRNTSFKTKIWKIQQNLKWNKAMNFLIDFHLKITHKKTSKECNFG